MGMMVVWLSYFCTTALTIAGISEWRREETETESTAQERERNAQRQPELIRSSKKINHLLLLYSLLLDIIIGMKNGHKL